MHLRAPPIGPYRPLLLALLPILRALLPLLRALLPLLRALLPLLCPRELQHLAPEHLLDILQVQPQLLGLLRLLPVHLVPGSVHRLVNLLTIHLLQPSLLHLLKQFSNTNNYNSN